MNWWSHRLAGAGRPILLLPGDVGGYQVCRYCAVSVLDPKYTRPRKDQCSRCQLDRYQEWLDNERAKENHVTAQLPPVKCTCGFLLPKCEAHHCHPKKDVPQRKLFFLSSFPKEKKTNADEAT